MELGTSLPSLMPDASFAVQAPASDVEPSANLSGPLAIVDQAMTVGRDEKIGELLDKFSKDDMSPGDIITAQFEFMQLETRTLEITHLADSVKTAFQNLQQNG